MLLLSPPVYDARQRLWRDFNADKITSEVFFRKMLELDPNDFVGLVGTAKGLWEDGDLTRAEEYYWRAIQSNPCASDPYLDLGRLLDQQPDTRALALALAELGICKKSREQQPDEFLKELDYEKAGLQGKTLEEFKALPADMRVAMVVHSMPESQSDEPEQVTERLRQLRLIEQMQDEVELKPRTVDAIIAEGPAIVPLLVGVLRAWAQDLLPDQEGDADMENALALLGEIGSPEEIAHLLEFVDLKDTTPAGAASWALGRIIQRFPVESAHFIGTIVTGLGLAQRLKIAEQMLRHPGFDPSAKLLERLSETLEPFPKDERDAFLPMLLTATAAARGNAGLTLARATLRRHGGLLSRSARRECDDLLAMFVEEGIPPLRPPELSPRTVYDICAGEVNWELEEDEELDEERDDDFLPEPEPVRRKATPGRNDPCWCNSGKKYKKCHLDSDQLESRQTSAQEKPLHGTDEFTRLRKDIGEFLGQVLPQREMEQALTEFFGDGPPGDTETEIPLIDWMIHDRVSPSLGQTVMEEFLERRPRLTAREREMVEAWSRSHIGLYEVQQLKAGVGVELKDLIFDKTFFVHDVNLSTRLTKWDGILARVVPGERGTELAGSTLTVPRVHLRPFREWLDDDREESGLEWREYLKDNWPRIRRHSFEIAANWMESLHLVNNDGDELLLSKALYRTIDEVAVIGALQLSPEFSDNSAEDETGTRFVWLNDEKTVLGNVHIGSGKLTLEANSRQRLERGKRLLTGLAGEALKHLRDEFTTQKDIKRRVNEDPFSPKPASREIPKEVSDEIITEAMNRHYSGWPDVELPALNGKTPRQAVKTAKGREQVVTLLKDFENGEERKKRDGEVFYDVNRLRAALGLDQ
jgi:hypothetical protein